jgi:two-component system KDP operon response regulator KdpE
MSGERVLVIEDEGRIAQFIERGLIYEGYRVTVARDGKIGLATARDNPPDLVILDWMLPVLDGLEVCKRLRAASDVPILMLTAKDDVKDRVTGLDAGADDYLVKPFSVGELMARIRAAMRRAMRPSVEPVFEVNGLVLDMAHRLVMVKGEAVSLTPTEYDLLRVLATDAGKVLTHAQLLRQVWGMGYENDSHLLRVNISNLRRKIEPDPSQPTYVVTEPGVGYRLWLEE